jgi:hypothetical protein
MKTDERIVWATKNSSYVANAVKHVWTSELLRYLWLHFPGHKLQMFHAEVDDCGYDIVLTLGSATRHVQLKASHAKAKATGQDIHSELARAVGGCVVWMFYDPVTWQILSYRFFGSAPGEPMPSLQSFPIAVRVFPNRQGILPPRPNVRRLKKSLFTIIPTMDLLVTRLFGIAPEVNA